MAFIFSSRSDDVNFYAKYSTDGKGGVPLTSQVVRTADAGAIGGFNYDFTSTSGGAKNGLYFRGANVNYNSSGISMLFRVKPNYTGTPAASRGLFGIGTTGATNTGACIMLTHAVTTGNITVLIRNAASTAVLNGTSFGAWSPTSGTWYDIVLTWDWSASASSCKLYIDAALLGGQTPSAAFLPSGTFPYDGFTSIIYGAGPQQTAANSMNEGVIWNSVIDPTVNQNLESGLGLLNGASRTSFVSDVAGSPLAFYDGLAGGGIQISYVGLGNNKLI